MVYCMGTDIQYPAALEIIHRSKTIWITFFIFCNDILLAGNFDKILSNADDHAKKILLITMTVVHSFKHDR